MGPSVTKNPQEAVEGGELTSSINAAPGPSSLSSASGAKTSPSDYIPQITDALDKLTTHAASLPPKSDLSFHRTLDRRFAKSLDVTSSKLLLLTERLLRLVETTPGPSKAAAGKSKGKGRSALVDEEDAVEGFRRSVGNVIDGLLEDADSRLDEVSGQKKVSAIKVDPILAASASQKLPGPFAPNDPSSSSSKKTRLPLDMMSADIPKPQQFFPDPVDNTPNRPWKPTLVEKPHAMVPLTHPVSTSDLPSPESASDTKQAEQRKRRRKERNHPYWFETQHLPYPTRMFEILPPIPPVPLEDAPLTFVDTPESLQEMVELLKEAKEIAVDLEHHSNRSYYGFTCLMQVSTRERDWVVDTLKLRGELREGKLGGVMADPKIVKVFHGADSDIVWLQKDFDTYIVNLFDTYHATKVLNFTSHSLASLLARYSSFTADKRYQMADWRIRPLPQEMIDYARSDTHYLLNIYDHLRNALLEMSSRPSTPQPLDPSDPLNTGPGSSTPRQNPQAALRRTLELSAETALKPYEKEEYMFDGSGPGGWRVIVKKFFPRGSEGSVEVAVVKALHAWRDTTARELDESPYYIMPNDAIHQISVLRVPNKEVVERLVRKRKMAASGYIKDILDMVIMTRKTYRPPSPPAGPTAPNTPNAQPASAISLLASSQRASATPQPGLSDSKPDFESIWSSLSAASSTKTLQPKTKSKSTLFGNTVSYPSSSGSKSGFGLSRIKSKSSALFGTSLSTPSTSRTKKEGSPTFDAVRRRILDAINPGGLLVDMNNESTSASSSTGQKGIRALEETRGSAVQPETVPFVPVNKRTGFSALKEIAQKSRAAAAAEKNTVVPGATKEEGQDETLNMTSKEVKKGKDEIVNVKRQNKKKEKTVIQEIEVDSGVQEVEGSGTSIADETSSGSAKKRARSGTTSTIPPSSAAYSTSAASSSNNEINPALPPIPMPNGSIKKKKNKKAKISAGDIPSFDYSTEGNLLDYPAAAPRDDQDGGGKKKKKKDKKGKMDAPPAMMIETPNFGKMPRDMTQPKAGARSKTFTS